MTYPVPAAVIGHLDELDQLDGRDELYDGLPCQFCDEGMVLVCPDDLCRGNGGCRNLPGRRVKEGCYGVCPYCKGDWAVTALDEFGRTAHSNGGAWNLQCGGHRPVIGGFSVSSWREAGSGNAPACPHAGSTSRRQGGRGTSLAARRNARVEASMPTSPDLTAEDLRSILDYDPTTGVFRWKERTDIAGRRDQNAWNTRYAGTEAGNIRPTPWGGFYRVIRIRGRRYYAHRLAWFYVYGKWPSGRLDHRDGDGLHNWIDNLRPATPVQNARNSKRRNRGRSGFKGVSWKTGRGKWVAQIRDENRNVHLGYFDTPEEAHAAYVEAARERFGEFARAE